MEVNESYRQVPLCVMLCSDLLLEKRPRREGEWALYIPGEDRRVVVGGFQIEDWITDSGEQVQTGTPTLTIAERNEGTRGKFQITYSFFLEKVQFLRTKCWKSHIFEVSTTLLTDSEIRVYGFGTSRTRAVHKKVRTLYHDIGGGTLADLARDLLFTV